MQTRNGAVRYAFDNSWERARQRALQHMVETLSPGGWLLVEEMDFSSFSADRGCGTATRDLFLKMGKAHHTVMRAHGTDPWYGRDLLRDLRLAGLDDVDAEGRVSICEGGSPGAVAWHLTFEQLRNEIVEAGAASYEEVAHFLTLLDDPQVTFESQVTMAAWGRLPEHVQEECAGSPPERRYPRRPSPDPPPRACSSKTTPDSVRWHRRSRSRFQPAFWRNARLLSSLSVQNGHDGRTGRCFLTNPLWGGK